jgi:hypothetical protein
MVQPIQYQIPGALNPFENLVSGLKLGATMADMDAARAQQQAAVQLAQQKALAEQAAVEQKALADAEISAYLNKSPDQRTQEDTRKLVRFLPAAQIQNLMAADAALSDKQRENQVLFAAEVGSALKSKKPEIAMNRVRERLDAETDPQKKQGLKLLLDSIEKAPDLALETLRMSTLALGDNYEKAANAMFGTPAAAADGGKTISSAADKMAAGIVDAEGKPLPGTFFVERGKRPELVKGEVEAAMGGKTISSAADKMAAGITDAEGKPLPGTFFVERGKRPELVKGEEAPEVKKGYAILTPAEAKARGLPTSGYTWQYNQDTNDISALVKPTTPAVQVNMPGQPRPPSKLEEEMDKKFAPLAVEWMGGEKTKAASRINQLNAVTNILETQKRITGPVLGLTPDVVQSFVAPASREARANAERVIQEGLRATIGAQFTRAEGEAFLARSYDPKAPQADNARRLRSIVTQMTESAKDREAMVKYMQGPGQGSLQGYTGRIPSIQDFYDAIEEKAPTPAQAPTPAMPPGFVPAMPPGFKVLRK